MRLCEMVNAGTVGADGRTAPADWWRLNAFKVAFFFQQMCSFYANDDDMNDFFFKDSFFSWFPRKS